MNLDLTVVAIYFVFLTLVGLVFSRMVRDSDDYFRAGAQGTWWLVGASMFMAGISAYTFVGNAVGIYESGWSPLVLYLANFLAMLVCVVGLAAWYRQMRVVTVAEVLLVRFGKATEQFVAVLVIINSLVWSGVVLYGLSIFSRLLFPETDARLLIVGVGLIVILYCTFGGNWAVMANDFVQGLILVSMTILLTVLCFVEVGGVGAFFSAIADRPEVAADFRLLSGDESVAGEGGFWSVKYGLTWAIAAFIAQFVLMLGLFQGVRYFSAKDGRTASWASLLGAALMAMGCIVFFIPPMYARLFLSDQVLAMSPDPLRAPEYSYAVASAALLPNGMFSIMIVAMFAAAVSSMDTGLNRNSALIVRDLLPGVFRLFGWQRLPAHREVLAGRLATLACGVIIIGLALFYAAIEGVTLFDMMLQIVSMLMAPQTIPLLLFLVVRKTAWWAAISAIAAGFLPSIINYAFDLNWSYQVLTFVIVGASLLGYLVAVPFYSTSSEAYRQRIAAFYKQMHTPVDFAQEVGAANDTRQMRLLGAFGTVLGILLSLLLLLPNDAAGRGCIVGVVAFILVISVSLLLAGRRPPAAVASADE